MNTNNLFENRSIYCVVRAWLSGNIYRRMLDIGIRSTVMRKCRVVVPP